MFLGPWPGLDILIEVCEGCLLGLLSFDAASGFWASILSFWRGSVKIWAVSLSIAGYHQPAAHGCHYALHRSHEAIANCSLYHASDGGETLRGGGARGQLPTPNPGEHEPSKSTLPCLKKALIAGRASREFPTAIEIS